MYASLGDLVKDLFGINISFLYILQMFGLIMAISFIIGAWILSKELKRKEEEGLLQPVLRRVTVGAAATPLELILNALGGFILGYKVVGIIFNLSVFIANPQAYVFSKQGNWWGAIIVSALFVYFKYAEKKKARLPEPKVETHSYHPYQLVGDLTIYGAIAGLIGAKIFDNLEHMDSFLADPIGSLLSFSGLTFYGGLIFGAATVIWYCRKSKIPIIHMSDAVSPTLIIGYAIGRIGCQVAGDGDWGIVNTHPKPSWLGFMPDWFWAYTYPHNVNDDGVPIFGCVERHCMQLPLPVFPTPLYETLACFAIFFFLWSIRKRLKVPGMLFAIYLVLNGIERFLIELIRVNSHYHFWGISASQAEIIALCIIVCGIGWGIYSNRLYKKSGAITPKE